MYKVVETTHLFNSVSPWIAQIGPFSDRVAVVHIFELFTSTFFIEYRITPSLRNYHTEVNYMKRCCKWRTRKPTRMFPGNIACSLWIPHKRQKDHGHLFIAFVNVLSPTTCHGMQAWAVKSSSKSVLNCTIAYLQSLASASQASRMGCMQTRFRRIFDCLVSSVTH